MILLLIEGKKASTEQAKGSLKIENSTHIKKKKLHAKCISLIICDKLLISYFIY